MAMGGNKGPQGAGEEIKLIVEKMQRVRAEIKELRLDLSDIVKEAKGRGFDPKPIQKLVAWLEKDPNKRFEEDAIFELYKQAIGVGDGSLSDMARDYVTKKRADLEPADDGQLDAFAPPTPEEGMDPAAPDIDPEAAEVPLTEDDARQLGKTAALAGKLVTANPFRAGDPRRAAWDEAWCGALGTDGMDIPPELRAPVKKKKDDDKKGGGE